MVNTAFLNQADARNQLLKYLADRLDPTQVLALAVIDGKGLRVLSDLTTDPSVLIAALKKVSGEPSSMEGFQVRAQAIAGTGVEPSGLLGGISRGQSPEAVFRRFRNVGAHWYDLFAFVGSSPAAGLQLQPEHRPAGGCARCLFGRLYGIAGTPPAVAAQHQCRAPERAVLADDPSGE